MLEQDKKDWRMFSILALTSIILWFALDFAGDCLEAARTQDNVRCEAHKAPSCVGASQVIRNAHTDNFAICACSCDSGELVLHAAPLRD